METPKGKASASRTKMRTPMSRYRRGPYSRPLNSSFKSPVRSPAPAPSTSKDPALVAAEVEALRKKEADLKEQIAQLEQEGYDVEDLPECIQVLHRYNEMKDVGQMLLGRLATLEGVTTREMYSKFDLELED